MGWQDAPLIEAPAAQPAWMSAPEVKPAAAKTPSPQTTNSPVLETLKSTAANVWGGAIRGAGSIGATVMMPYDALAKALKSSGVPALVKLSEMPWLENEGNAARREKIDAGLTQLIGSDPQSAQYIAAKLGGEMAGTAGVPESMAAGAAKLGLPRLAAAIAAGGFSGKQAPIGIRMAGGALAGAGTAAAVDPSTVPAGAVIGGAFPLTAPLGRKATAAAGYVYDMLSGAQPAVQAGSILREAAGNQLGAVRAANAAAPTNVLASQAAAGVPQTDAYQAVLQAAEQRDIAGTARAVRTRQGADLLGELNRIAGGATSTETRAATDTSHGALNALTGPMRETELNAANAPGQAVAAEAANLHGLSPVDIGDVRAAAIAKAGVKPLDPAPVLAGIRGLAAQPGVRVNVVQSGALNHVADMIEQDVAAHGGVLDARALYGIRKSGVNEVIQKLYPNADAAAQKKYAAQLLTDIKPMIDDAIEKAGGTGWRDYLQTFSQGADAITQTKVAGLARDMYRDNPNQFIKLVRGNNPDAIEKEFGPGSYDIVKQLGQKYGVLDKAATYLEGEQKVSDAAKAGSKAAADIFDRNYANTRIPNLFSPKITVANKLLEGVEGRANAKTMQVLTEASRSGRALNDAMSVLPATERTKVLNFMRNDPRWSNMLSRGTAISGGNALAPQ